MAKRKNKKKRNNIFARDYYPPVIKLDHSEKDKPLFYLKKSLGIDKTIKLPDNLYATNVKDKLKYFNQFIKLLKDQFQYGGKKYELLPGIESTDILTLSWGVEGLLWTINKYLFRFKNFHREKDLLKIATYMYIIWLKYGFHLKQEHDTDTGKKK